MYAAVFHEFNQKEIALLRRDIANGLNVRALMGDNASGLFRYRSQIKARLMEILQSVKAFGIGQVHEEIDRQ